jgi:alcohol dehydrogenase class IV
MVYEAESVWDFSMTGNVRFGQGVAAELPSVLEALACESVMVVTDPGLRSIGVIDPVLSQLEDEGIELSVFSDVEPEPALAVFEASIDQAREFQPGGIIGIGGGSSMDVAKTTAVLTPYGGEILDYVAPPTGAGEPIPGAGLPTVCLPTTAGTGAETSPVSVISLPDRNLKVGISGSSQLPDAALVDPALTVTLPPGPTASSGIDALSHAIEAYVTRRYSDKPSADVPTQRPDYGGRTVLTDQLALRAIKLISTGLRRAVNNGHDLDARRAMSLGSLLAGMAFTNAGLGLAHAMAMATGARHHTVHGETIATVLPWVVRYNASAAADRYAEIARVMGENTANASDYEGAEMGAIAIERLRSDVGLATGLADLGVDGTDIDTLARNAVQLERLVVGNPRRVEESDMRELFENAL